MYTPIWNAVRAHLSAERMQAEVAEFFAFSRWSSFDKIVGLAQRIAERMEAMGLEDVRLIEFPADGRTAYGGWRMPCAYDVEEAHLTLLGAGDTASTLADYQLNPTCLMLYSLPTPPEGITAELVVADRLEEMTAARLEGRLALTSGIGVEYGLTAMGAGALGLVSDCRNAHRFFKNGPEVDLTNEWHNYTIPPWDEPEKGFGFSLSPEQGRRLRSLLAAGETLRLHALVKTRHYDGVLPVVSGRLPGRMPDEIVLTGHYDEFGADDNCSQVAVILEVFRAIQAMLHTGEIPPLQRSLRILLPMEVRGFNALIQNPAETCHLCAGLNIDTVGTDQNRATTTCTLADNFVALPSYTAEFAAELLTRLAQENPLFRWRPTDADMIDNIFGEPLVGAPTPALWHFSATHHLATDTPDRISGRMLEDMAQVAATYAAFLANAGLQEAIWLAELTADRAVRRFQEVAAMSLRSGLDTAQAATVRRQLNSAFEIYSQKLGSSRPLTPSLRRRTDACKSLRASQNLPGLRRFRGSERRRPGVCSLRAGVGRPPYDPHTTPSEVGAVTDRFWRRPGVLRSAHPTHSFAAIGSHASALLADHGPSRSPLSQDGPLGRLADLDSKILLFSPRGTNTAMHLGEYRVGLPLLDFLCPVMEDGVRREALVPDCPWHARFEAAYKRLYGRNLITDVALGEETFRVMRCRDAIDAQAEVMRETPEALIEPDCACPYCRRLEQYCRENDRPLP